MKKKQKIENKKWTINKWLSLFAILIPLFIFIYTNNININVRIAKLSERCENNTELMKNNDKKIVEYGSNIKKCEKEVSHILGQFNILKELLLRNVIHDLNNNKKNE